MSSSKNKHIKNYEPPDISYTISGDNLAEILKKHGITNKESFEKIFTDLHRYETPSILKIPLDEEDTEESNTLKKPVIVNGLFYIPSKSKKKRGKYKYLKIKLAPSTIKNAGTGAYAVDPIPEGARAFYRGIAKNENYTNPYYSWTVKTFDKKTGEPDDADEPSYYIDAYDTNASNWTRYVNCGLKDKYNNMDSTQIYDKFYYVATKNIKPGDELFIDYGVHYRKENLKMKGKY